jgi:eukaryotic-like serine/threonine-protein kinase
VLAPEHAAVPNYLARFQQEGRHGAALGHPHLVRTYAIGHDSAVDLHYLVLEHIDGPSAQELIERHDRLPVGDAVAIVRDVARALQYAHARAVIHRDIKPGNILLIAAGAAKLADLGLAKKTDEPSMSQTLTNQGFGTPFYVAPEQALNARNADPRSDLYALGATLYHLLTGVVPFPGHGPLEIIERKQAGEFIPAHSFNPTVPAPLETILRRLLAHDPNNRYPSATALLADLKRLRLAAALPRLLALAPSSKSAKDSAASPLETTSPALETGALAAVRDRLCGLGARLRALLP